MKIFFSVGEPSGDHHAAELIREISCRCPHAEFYGYGGEEMEKAGCRILFPMANYPLMGFLQIAPFLWMFWKLAWRARKIFRTEKPDALVLVDYPGFNWWMAWYAKGAGIKTIYYMPPQLWAWGGWRVKRVQRNIDLVLTGLSFETQWYRSHGVQSEFVGNPFFDKVSRKPLDEEFMTTLRPTGKRPVAILPGSRMTELKYNFAMQLGVAKLVHKQHPETVFHVANFKPAHVGFCQAIAEKVAPDLPLTFQTGRLSEIVEQADCALMVSGSVSLEMLARRCPTVAVYRTGTVLFFVARYLMTVDYMSLPNLLVNRAMMPEFAFFESTWRYEHYIAASLNYWLSNEAARQLICQEMDEVCRAHNHDGASEIAAQAILKLLGQQASTTEKKLAA